MGETQRWFQAKTGLVEEKILFSTGNFLVPSGSLTFVALDSVPYGILLVRVRVYLHFHEEARTYITRKRWAMPVLEVFPKKLVPISNWL